MLVLQIVSDPGWAWNPESIGAIATGAATLLAAWAALLATREAKGRRLQQVRAQAERVTAWADWEVQIRDDGEDTGPTPVFVLRVANHSSLPVTNVRVVVHPADYELDPEAARRFLPLLAPGQSVQTTMTYLMVGHETPRSHQELPELSFRDAQGERWYRDERGRLTAHKKGVVAGVWLDAEGDPDDARAVGWGSE